MEVVASLSQGRTAAAQCGLFTYKSVPVLIEPPCICFLNLQSLRYREEGSFHQKDQSMHLWEKEFFQYCSLYGKTRSFLMLVQVLPTVTTGFCIQHSRQPLGLISETDTVYCVILFPRTPNNDPLNCSAAMQNACSSNRN